MFTENLSEPSRRELELLAVLAFIETKTSEPGKRIMYEEKKVSEYIEDMFKKYESFFMVRVTDYRRQQMSDFYRSIEEANKQTRNIELIAPRCS